MAPRSVVPHSSTQTHLKVSSTGQCKPPCPSHQAILNDSRLPAAAWTPLVDLTTPPVRLAAYALLSSYYTTSGGTASCGPLSTSPDSDMLILGACAQVCILRTARTHGNLPGLGTEHTAWNCRLTSRRCYSSQATPARAAPARTQEAAPLASSCWALPGAYEAPTRALAKSTKWTLRPRSLRTQPVDVDSLQVRISAVLDAERVGDPINHINIWLCL